MIVGGWPWEAEGILLNKNLSEGLPWQSRDKDFTFQGGESGQGRRGLGSIPGQRAKIPYTLWPKNPNIKNRSSIVTNLIKTLKMVHIKKKKERNFLRVNHTKQDQEMRDTLSWDPLSPP